jgi:co-chaperonin GroES (HSP10)
MKAVNNYIIVQKIKTEQSKVAGLIITENIDDDNRYIKANVISTGNLVEGIKDGDVVYYDKHAGHGVQYKETLYYVIRNVDVVLID